MATKKYTFLFTLADGTTHSIPIEIPMGEDGGYYLPKITLVSESEIEITFIPSAAGMPSVDSVRLKLKEPGGNVVYDEEQELTDEQKSQARENIGAQPKGAYALRSEIPSVPVQSVNGKTGDVKLTASDVGARSDNWMPTAQEVGALPNTYMPPNQTAEQVGADPKGTASAAVSQHNTADDSHNDLRLGLKALSERLNAFFDTDDQTLDELSEIVAYITSNKSLIDSITTSKVSVTDIVDNLITNDRNKPLSAAQGVELKRLIDGIDNGNEEIPPSDWNAAEGEPGHILNRTHYTEGGMVELLPGCNPIYDEGEGTFVIMGAIPFVVGEEVTVNWNGTPYKCLTYAFVPNEETGELVVFGNSEALTDMLGLAVEANDAPFFFLSSAIQSVTMVQPLDGSTEVTVSILSNGEIVHKLDNKYLDVDWLPGIAKKDILPLQTVETTTKTDQKYYFAYVPYNGADFWGTEISVGKKITVEVNGHPYECVVFGDAMDGFLTSAGTVNLAFYHWSIVVSTIGSQTLTLRIYIPDHKKMPMEYLPDEVGTVKSVNGVAPDESGNVAIEIPGGTVKTVNGTAPDENGNVEITIPDSDWNAAEGEPGHILNRPFYTEKKVIIPETRFEDEYHVVDKKYGIIIGERYTVIWNGNEYSCIAVAGQYIIDGTTYTAPKLEVGGPGEADYGDIFESPPEYEINQTIFSSFYETGPNTVSVIQDAEIVKIPEKYLPDGYVSGGNVAYDEAQNLTDEQKAQARENIGAQPKGNYLTEVPEGYAKKTDIPSLDGYAKTEDVPTDEEIIQLIKDNVPESSGGGIAVTGAKVGQTVKIAEVDENGVPTAWESVDFPSGGGEENWEFINYVKLTEDSGLVTFNTDANGNPFCLKSVTVGIYSVGASTNTKESYLKVVLNDVLAMDNATGIRKPGSARGCIYVNTEITKNIKTKPALMLGQDGFNPVKNGATFNSGANFAGLNGVAYNLELPGGVTKVGITTALPNEQILGINSEILIWGVRM